MIDPIACALQKASRLSVIKLVKKCLNSRGTRTVKFSEQLLMICQDV